jgi:hypothetical protein
MQRMISCRGGSPAKEDLLQRRISFRGGSPTKEDLLQRRISCREGSPEKEGPLHRRISCIQRRISCKGRPRRETANGTVRRLVVLLRRPVQEA